MLTLDHVVFPVRDAEKALAFYGDLLGLPLVQTLSGEDWGGFPWLMMIFGLGEDRELVTVALRGAPSPGFEGLPPDCRHYALAASNAAEMTEWRERLSDAGVAFWEEAHGDQRSLYFPDPDGVILEITWPRASVPQTPQRRGARTGQGLDRRIRRLTADRRGAGPRGPRPRRLPDSPVRPGPCRGRRGCRAHRWAGRGLRTGP